MSTEEEERSERAARKIQRVWRDSRKSQDFLTTNVRLNDAKAHAALMTSREAADAGRNTARARWRRAIVFASSLQDGNAILKENGLQDRAPSKFLETQHWLELVDGKHRYGSNLKASNTGMLPTWYHRRWQKEDTTENFFKWLDKGAGKTLSLEECSREQLERERITYLSSEQRLNYLIEIDNDGRLRWARNHDYVDTSAGRWKDSDGQGIVPDEDTFRNRLQRGQSLGAISQSTYSLDADGEAPAHYTTGSKQGKYRWSRVLRKRFTLHGIVDRLLRLTVKKNTWIYVSDKNFNIFIGIKKPGTFQHSSLLSGGVVTSAGLISVKEGVIHTLSPLSGHYRTSIEHFHQFIDVMKERGVDMSKARISKAELALWGVEHIKKFQKSQARVVASGKQGISDTMQKIGDVAHLSWKREILEGRRKPPSDDNTQAKS